MKDKSLAIAFGESLKDDAIGIVSDYAEIGLDAVIEDGILKEVPIVSTAVALYKIGNSIKERYNLKKLYIFMNAINKGIASKEKLEEYKHKFQSNDKFRNHEIEYLLVLIDRYISYDKPELLAKLYLAYLDEIIVWEELTIYAEIIDRFLLSDCNTLLNEDKIITVYHNKGTETILRLVSLGLMVDVTDNNPFVHHGNGNIGMDWDSLMKTQSKDKVYSRTEFGDKLVQILK